MRTRLTGLILLLLLLGLGGGCSGDKGRDLVVVSVYPYELLTRQLLGPQVEIRTLIPPNASPHTYAPRPSDLRALPEAELVVVNGFGLEANWRQALPSLGQRLLRVEDLPGLKEAAVSGEGNPHLWLSPPLLRVIIPGLSLRLQLAFPHLRAAIAKNEQQALAELAALDERIQRERKDYPRTPVVTYHDSFAYFFQAYGIDYLGSVQLPPGREPAPAQLAAIADLIRASGLRAIYVEPQLERRSATVLAREFGLQVRVLDPLGSASRAAGLTELLERNWEELRQGWQRENPAPAL